MEEGRVVEEGSNEEMIEIEKGVYESLYKLKRGKEEIIKEKQEEEMKKGEER